MMSTQSAESTQKSYPVVRVAVLADLPQLLQMGRDLHRENGLLSLSEEKIKEVALRGIEGKGGVIGVIGPIGAVEAMIHLVVGEYWYSTDGHIEELYNYVKPEYRRTLNAKALINYAKKCADRMNIPLLIGVISNKRTEAKIRLYKRMLGEPTGAYFLYNVHTGE